MKNSKFFLAPCLLTIVLALPGCAGRNSSGIPPSEKKDIRVMSTAPPVLLSNETSGIPEGTDIDALASSVFKLEVYDSKGFKTATGTGFIYGSPKVLATSAHVIVNMDYMEVTRDNGETFRITAKASYADKDKDIAFFKLPTDLDLPALKLKEGTPPRGTPVFTLGSQAGLTNLLTTGVVSGTWNESDIDYLLFTAPVSGGNSGGPVFDYDGNVVAVVIGTYEKAQNLNIGLVANELPETE